MVWSILWVGTFLLADAANDRGWITGNTGIIAATIVTTVIGLGWIVSYMRFLQHADELVRKIQLDAMASALGAGFVAGFALILLDSAGIFDAGIAEVLVVLSATYIVAVLVGIRRFGG